LRILHIATAAEGGGAFSAARRLHEGFVALGLSSKMIVGEGQSIGDKNICRIARPTGIVRWWRRRENLGSHPVLRGQEPFSGPRSIYRGWLEAIQGVDVIQLHWVGRFLDYPSFFGSLAPHQKVFWRLSDMNPLTGGCHYDDGCGKFLYRCGFCPQLSEPGKKDPSARALELKQKVFSRMPPSQLHLITASRWMHSMVQRSPLTNRFPAHHLPLGVDTEVFHDPSPEERSAIRAKFNFSPLDRVLLAGAGSLALRRKGAKMLIETLKKLGMEKGYRVMTFGDAPLSGLGEMEIQHLGKITCPQDLAGIYAAADLLLFFPAQENLANMLMESLACGTPAVATKVGGNMDCITPGSEGWLVPVENSEAAAASIRQHFSLEPPILMKMRANCRKKAEEHFCQQKQIPKFRDLYEKADPVSSKT